MCGKIRCCERAPPDDSEPVVSGSNGKRLSMWGLVALTFFAVSGGPYGIEDAIAAGYPAFTFLALLIIPWVWSLPSALMTAELSTAMPQNGGFVFWVQSAFGNFWGFQEAYWSFINNLFDLAIYPVLFETYLSQVVPQMKGGMLWPSLIRIGMLLFCVGLNLIGVDFVSKASGVFIFLLLLPFGILCALGVRHIRPADWIILPPKGPSQVDWGVLITSIAWNTGGFDNMSQVAGELQNPTKAYPRAMLIVLGAMLACYILPIMVGVSINTDYAKWTDGYFGDIAFALAGEWLLIMMTIGGALKMLGVLNTYLCTCSEMLCAWGNPDMLHLPFLTWRLPKFNTPWVAILLNAFLIAGGSFLQFEFLIQCDQLFYSLGLALEYFALIYLRFKKPDMHRPFQIPLNKYLLIAFTVLPLAFCFFCAATPFMSEQWRLKMLVVSVPLVLAGFALHPLVQLIKRLFASYQIPPTEEQSRLIN